MGNKPPDVAVAHLTRAKNLAAAGLLTEITDDDAGHWSASRPVRLRRSGCGTPRSYDGKSWVIPLDTHPYVLYYNREPSAGRPGCSTATGMLKPIEGQAAWEAALAAAEAGHRRPPARP